MEFMENTSQHNTKYAKISLELRKELISLVFNEKMSISRASKKLGINLSTAKLIIKKYKINGTFFVSKKQARQIMENQQNWQNVQTEIYNSHILTQFQQGQTMPAVSNGIVYFSQSIFGSMSILQNDSTLSNDGQPLQFKNLLQNFIKLLKILFCEDRNTD